MNDRQEDKLSSFYAVERVGLDYPLVISSIPALETAFTDHRQVIADIGIASIKQNQKTTGTTRTKQELREAITDEGKVIAGALVSYAIVEKDNDLAERFDRFDTEYSEVRDTRIREICQEIHDEALLKIVELAGYGLTIGELNAFQSDINAYHAMVGGPMVILGNVKTATGDLKRLFEKGNTLVEIMDGLVERFKKTNFEFYTKFKTAKKVIKRGGGGKGKGKEEEPKE